MTAHPSIDPARFLHEHLAQASPDLLRSLLTTMPDTLMSAEADAVCGAAHGERSEQRVNHRNGYRHRDFDTRAGTLDVAIPKLRQGSCFPDSENDQESHERDRHGPTVGQDADAVAPSPAPSRALPIGEAAEQTSVPASVGASK